MTTVEAKAEEEGKKEPDSEPASDPALVPEEVPEAPPETAPEAAPAAGSNPSSGVRLKQSKAPEDGGSSDQRAQFLQSCPPWGLVFSDH